MLRRFGASDRYTTQIRYHIIIAIHPQRFLFRSASRLLYTSSRARSSCSPPSVLDSGKSRRNVASTFKSCSGKSPGSTLNARPTALHWKGREGVTLLIPNGFALSQTVPYPSLLIMSSTEFATPSTPLSPIDPDAPPKLSDFARADVKEIVDKLTTDEAISLIAGVGFWWTAAVPRLGIPSIKVGKSSACRHIQNGC